MKATPKKLSYVDSDKEAPAKSLARGFSDRFSLKSSSTSDTHKQTRSASKSRRTRSKNKEPTHLRRLRRLEDWSITKEKTRRERSKPKEKKSKHQETNSDSEREEEGKIPWNIGVYEGNKDPEDHLGIFSAATKQEEWPMPIWCKMFRQTLSGATLNWFDDLDPKSVGSFEELSQKFLEEFSQQNRYAKYLTEIYGIKGRQNEGLQAFMDWFKSESSHIKGIHVVLRILAFMHGHGHPELAKKLNDKIPKTVGEMFERVKAFIRGEVVAGSAEMVRPSQGDKGYIGPAWTGGPKKARNRGGPREIEPTVTLFRVFQTLCKQGDWFSFAKRRAPSPVCIDDNCSCMKHWKSGFFLIDQRAIPDVMVWRHPDAAINDLSPDAGSFNMANVCHLSAHVIKLRDMPKGVLVLSGLSRVWKNHFCDLVLRGADRNVMGIHDFLCLPEWTDAEDLVVGTPSSKIIGKAEASQMRKASTFGVASSHVAKRTRSALAQLYGSTTRLSLFACDDDESDDDDACVEIPLVTPLCSAAVILSSGNQDSRGKVVMVDDVAASSAGVSRPRPSSGFAPSFKDVFDDSIHKDFFPFSAGLYYATYPEGGVAGNCESTWEEWDAPYRPTFEVLTKEVFKDLAVCKTIVDQFPTPDEMVRIEGLYDDQLTTKMSVLHYMMMSHGGELLARYRGLNQSHHEYVLSTYSRLKGYEEKC
ncbi:reverse transcriptase domain-containing protein [Tanacetum coccineum]